METADASLRGRLLVASTTLSDPNFARTVVLVLEHGDDGTLGLVLNRPGTIALADALPDWRPAAADPPVVFHGGPVQPEAVICLVRLVDDIASVHPVLPGVAVADAASGLPPAARALRVFAGYAGWGPRQIEAEIQSGGWFVVEAGPDDAFAADSQRLWRAVLVRQGGVFKTVTWDPTSN